MSCDAAALALSLHLASYDPAEGAPRLIRAIAAAPPRATNPLAKEPLFRSIVGQASALQAQVGGWRKAARDPSPADREALEAKAKALSDLDMQGHLALAKRGTDGDLKCILRGLSQDLPRRIADLKAAPDAPKRKAALDELFYLLRDNVEVLTAAPTTSSTAVAG